MTAFIEATDWADGVHRLFTSHRVDMVSFVPDGGHKRLIELCLADPAMRTVTLTTEEEGIAFAAGAFLGGERAALLMQSSGVGNCVNMFSIVRGFGVPCLVLVTMRGEFAEFNPWQVPMGSITQSVLESCGFLTYRVDNAEDVDTVVGAACDMAFNGNMAIAVLLSQRLIGRKQWVK